MKPRNDRSLKGISSTCKYLVFFLFGLGFVVVVSVFVFLERGNLLRARLSSNLLYRWRLALNFWSFCCHYPHPRATGRHHNTVLFPQQACTILFWSLRFFFKTNTVYPRLVPNSQRSACLSLPFSVIAGTFHHTYSCVLSGRSDGDPKVSVRYLLHLRSTRVATEMQPEMQRHLLPPHLGLLHKIVRYICATHWHVCSEKLAMPRAVPWQPHC